jgi:hypothetical protein
LVGDLPTVFYRECSGRYLDDYGLLDKRTGTALFHEVADTSRWGAVSLPSRHRIGNQHCFGIGLVYCAAREDLGMTTGQGAAVQRQRLRTELRNERQLVRLTQKQVARAMDWSPSKMLRIETGLVSISVTDLRALLTYYNIKDKRRTDELVNLARAAKTRRNP